MLSGLEVYLLKHVLLRDESEQNHHTIQYSWQVSEPSISFVLWIQRVSTFCLFFVDVRFVAFAQLRVDKERDEFWRARVQVHKVGEGLERSDSGDYASGGRPGRVITILIKTQSMIPD